MMHCNRFVAAATGRGWRRRWVGPDLTAVVARHVRWVVPTSPAINVEESGLTLGTSPPTDQSMFAASGTCLGGGDGACHQGARRTGFSTRGRCSDWCVTQTARSSLLKIDDATGRHNGQRPLQPPYVTATCSLLCLLLLWSYFSLYGRVLCHWKYCASVNSRVFLSTCVYLWMGVFMIINLSSFYIKTSTWFSSSYIKSCNEDLILTQVKKKEKENLV